MGSHRVKIAIGIVVCLLAGVGSTIARAGQSGLVAAYSFNESLGTVAKDSSGHANHGAIDGAERTTGRYGSGLRFDGVSDVVTVPNSASLNLVGAMTLEAWVRPDVVSDWSSVVLKETSNGLAYSLYAAAPYGGGGAWVRPSTSGDQSAQMGSRLPTGRWSHLAATFDGQTIRFYLNGSLKASRTLAAGTRLVDSTGALRIGGNSVWGEWFTGIIDEIRVYDRALSASEIRADRSAPITGEVVAAAATTASTTTSSTASTTTSTTASTTIPTTTAPAPVAVPDTTPPLPSTAGVTLREVDGGVGYFGKWANSFPTDPNFFPIGVWAETLADPSFIGQYKAIGINTFTNLWDGPTQSQMDQVKANGMYGVSDPSDYALSSGFNSTYGGSLGGFMYTDEPDGNNVCGWISQSWLKTLCKPTADGNRTDPVSLQAMSNAIRSRDNTRPVYGQFTKPVALSWYMDDTTARQYIASADVVSFDYYPLTDVWTPGQVWDQHDAVKNIRRLANNTKPVWPFIETSHVFPEATYKPTPADINAEVWNAIIGGARGIQYFNHSFKAGWETQRVLLDSRYTDVRAQVSTTNARIKALAPVLNAPYADGFLTAPATTNTMVKAHGGSYYVFATTRQKSSLSPTFRVAAGSTVEVLNESRTLPITNGTFTDTFANQNTVHIYKITP